MAVVRDWFNQNFADKYYHANHVPLSSWDHYTSVNGAALNGIDGDGYRNFLATYKANIKAKAGLSDSTIEYLADYK